MNGNLCTRVSLVTRVCVCARVCVRERTPNLVNGDLCTHVSLVARVCACVCVCACARASVRATTRTSWMQLVPARLPGPQPMHALARVCVRARVCEHEHTNHPNLVNGNLCTHVSLVPNLLSGDLCMLMDN